MPDKFNNEERKLIIGASEIGAILNLDPHQTPIDIYMRKVLDIKDEETEPMKMGKLMEPIIGKLYEDKTGEKLEHNKTILKHPMGYAGCTPDFFVMENDQIVKLVQAKNVYSLSPIAKAEEETDDLPDHFIMQGIFELGVSRETINPGIELDMFAILLGGNRFMTFKVQFDAELFSFLYQKAKEFIENHIIPKVPPPIDSSKAYSNFLTKSIQHPTSKEIRQATELEIEMMLRLQNVKQNIKTLEIEEQWLKNNLKKAIGEIYGIESNVAGILKVIWYPVKGRTIIDWEAIENELRGLYISGEALDQLKNKHTKKGEAYRVLKTYP